MDMQEFVKTIVAATAEGIELVPMSKRDMAKGCILRFTKRTSTVRKRSAFSGALIYEKLKETEIFSVSI